MQYTTLGKRTGDLKVSVLGFGAMRLPMKGAKVDYDLAVPMMQWAFELGVNYIDSAAGYCGSDSETAIGKALKGWRDKIIVSTKNPSWSKGNDDGFWRSLEGSLKKLDINQIDLYCLHSLDGKGFDNHVNCKGGSYKSLVKAKEQGLIKHICFSFHDWPKELERICRSGLFDVVTCQYNILDRINEPIFPIIRKLGMGIVVMGPVGGGRLGAPSDALMKIIPGAASVPEVALRFVFANPYVSVAISGMTEVKQVEENCRIAAKTSLSAAEKRKVETVLARYKKLADLYCTGCKYCMPCPQGVKIPANFDSLNEYRVYELKDRAKREYANRDNRAALCIGCGKCITKCPQKINIISQLHETVRTLDEDYGKLFVRLTPGKLGRCTVANGRAYIEMTARLDCYNISDQPARPSIELKPGRGLEITGGKTVGELGSFGFGALGLKLAGAVKPDKPLDLGVAVENAKNSLAKYSKLPQQLQILPALKGGEKSLAKGLKAHALIANGEAKKATAAARSHGAAITAAYDAKNLYIRVNIKDDAAFPPDYDIGRWVDMGDRIELELALPGLAQPVGQEAAKLYWKILIGLPTPSTNKCRVGFWRPDWFPEESISITPHKLRGGCRLDIALPWEFLSCPPGARGSALGFNLTHISHDKKGKMVLSRRWASDAGWIVLA